MEIEIEGVDGSFLLAMTNEFDIDDHIVDKVKCRLSYFPFVTTSQMYASVLGLAKREEGE